MIRNFRGEQIEIDYSPRQDKIVCVTFLGDPLRIVTQAELDKIYEENDETFADMRVEYHRAINFDRSKNK